ncbi:MAG: bifunctional nuclease family protein [Treponema sp.]|jgi:bifunctional DNase/RNase|nr:bifunctional nuclease family protein [Treponema sp.]
MDAMLAAEIWTITRTEQGNAVLLRPFDMDLAVPLYIGQLEAESILIGLGEAAVPRPLTHDLFLNLLASIAMDLLQVEISELKDDIFYTRLLFTGRDYSRERPLILDARPSDALALAVRRKCPLFIAKKIISRVGVPVDRIMEAALEFMPGGERRELLLAELDKALADEEYERAAEIRDTLIRLDRERKGM